LAEAERIKAAEGKFASILDGIGPKGGRSTGGIPGSVSGGGDLWEEVRTTDGQLYYFCPSTGKTSWDRPERSVAPSAAGQVASTSSTAVPLSTSASAGTDASWETRVREYAAFYGMGSDPALPCLRAFFGTCCLVTLCLLVSNLLRPKIEMIGTILSVPAVLVLSIR
jgi:hypothetical protein